MRLDYNSSVRGIFIFKGPHVALIFIGPGALMGPPWALICMGLGPPWALIFMGPPWALIFMGPPWGSWGPPWAQAAGS